MVSSHSSTKDYEQVKWEIVSPSTEHIPCAREFPCISYDKGNQCVYLFGGFGDGQRGGYLNDFWKFDLKSREWINIETTGSIPSARCGCSGSYAASREKFFVFGGYHGDYLNDFYELDLKTREWKALNYTHDIPSLTVLTLNNDISDNYLTIFGGFNSRLYTTNMYHYNLDTQQWKTAATELINIKGEGSSHSRCLTLRGKYKNNIPNRNNFLILFHDAGANIFEYDEEESQLIKYQPTQELQEIFRTLEAKFIAEINENTLLILGKSTLSLIESRKFQPTKSLDYFTQNLKERTKYFSDIVFL
ncbi:predicted protein [Naegleria gruberi]|uniref:Predicted protein n=1 Tax=Naegleria gruberi TaxID=5762 RepID=D2V015_NAEGR|nr:uncharacterized protein NAEGRDRAFT_62135 [Naegleria gruberi]EFC49449.1 predicted protein [Naegleria gruberi]|eukprot:XP_002682193.1 predicted protein [Naegleria gruberi strain NEG-M]